MAIRYCIFNWISSTKRPTTDHCSNGERTVTLTRVAQIQLDREKTCTDVSLAAFYFRSSQVSLRSSRWRREPRVQSSRWRWEMPGWLIIDRLFFFGTSWADSLEELEENRPEHGTWGKTDPKVYGEVFVLMKVFGRHEPSMGGHLLLVHRPATSFQYQHHLLLRGFSCHSLLFPLLSKEFCFKLETNLSKWRLVNLIRVTRNAGGGSWQQMPPKDPLWDDLLYCRHFAFVLGPSLVILSDSNGIRVQVKEGGLRTLKGGRLQSVGGKRPCDWTGPTVWFVQSQIEEKGGSPTFKTPFLSLSLSLFFSLSLSHSFFLSLSFCLFLPPSDSLARWLALRGGRVARCRRLRFMSPVPRGEHSVAKECRIPSTVTERNHIFFFLWINGCGCRCTRQRPKKTEIKGDTTTLVQRHSRTGWMSTARCLDILIH